jgi:hypothetical protein
LYVTLPVPVPLPAVIVIQVSDVVALQLQPVPVVTVKFPLLPPLVGKFWLVGFIEYVHVLKFPVSVIGPFMVMVAGLFGPVYEPLPLPVQPLKLKPMFGIALICTLAPLLYQPPDAGGGVELTVPPFDGFGFIVN